MTDESNEANQQMEQPNTAEPQENQAGEESREEERVLATGASGDPNNPEEGVPGYLRPGMDVEVPPAPGETDKVVPSPQEPVDGDVPQAPQDDVAAQPTDVMEQTEAAPQPARVNRETR